MWSETFIWIIFFWIINSYLKWFAPPSVATQIIADLGNWEMICIILSRDGLLLAFTVSV